METIPTLQPGLIRTFRVYTGVRAALFVFSLLSYILGVGLTAVNYGFYLVLMLLDVGLLLVYLSLPRLRILLKNAYLPIGILWAAVGPIVQLHMFFYMFSVTVPDRLAFLLILMPVLVLFIPLVIAAWQYSMRVVMLFCGFTFLLDFVLAIIAYASNSYPVTRLSYISPMMAMAFTRTVLFLLLGNMISNLMKVQREQHQRLAEANQRLSQYATTLEQLTISRERNRMARELHDVLAHTMSGVAVELEGVRAMLRVDPDQAETLLGQSLKAVREGLTETRRALQALRATPLEGLGLGLAIEQLAESIAGRSGLQTELQIEHDMRDYPVEIQQCFYRVAQEALTNVVAHSQASKVQVGMKGDETSLKLWIRDDGIGFDQQSVDLKEKYGLLGMRERVDMIHGELTILSQVGAGTEICLSYQGAL
jgi:signal transduction histidine kinase